VSSSSQNQNQKKDDRMSLSEHFAPPAAADPGDGLFARPRPKAHPTNDPDGVMAGLHGDAELVAFVRRRRPTAATAAGVGVGVGVASVGNDSSGDNPPKTSGGLAVVEYGASWCAKCHEMFPAYLGLARKYPQHRYAVAHVDELSAKARSGALFGGRSGSGGNGGDGGSGGGGTAVRYTPTFALYDGSGSGRQVGEVVGRDPQRLEDHLWLHSD
jgi:thiol-disulfide isomerase/thioredoxin